MLYRMLFRQAHKQPRKAAVIGEERTLTYRQLLREVDHAALYFRRCGFGCGDRLILGIPPCPEFYVLFYAAAAVGMAVIPVSASGILPKSVTSVGAAVVAGDRRFLDRTQSDELRTSHKIVWNRLSGLSIRQVAGNFVRDKIIRKEPMLGALTSGTTGEPALFLRPADILLRRARLGAAAWGVSAPETLLSTGPFTSGVNAVYHLVVPMLVGCTVVVLEKFDRGKAVTAISDHGVTWIFAVPLVFDILARLPRGYQPNFSSLKRCSSVGAHLPRSIYDAFYEKFGLRIAQGYGGTDFAPAFTVNRKGVRDAVGRRDGPFPVNIVNDKAKPMRCGAVGEIVFDVSKVKDRAAKAALEKNSRRRGRYVFTGDLGRLDESGNLYIVGRKSSLIKVGANRVVPEEVESAMRSHPGVREVLIYPLRPGNTDEAVGAVVVRNGRLTAEELTRYCAERLDSYKCPQQIVFRRNLARNKHGKIMRRLFNSP